MMNIAKLYFDNELKITITKDTQINGITLDSRRPDLDIKQIINLDEVVEISNSKYTYFLNPSQVKFIKMLKSE